MLAARFDMFDEVIRDYYVHLPRSAWMEFRPRSTDLALVGECRSLLDVSNERSVARADIEAILPNVTARWEAEQKDQLFRMIKDALPGPVPEDINVLSLAVAVFGCPCIGGGYYPYSTRPRLGQFEPDPARFPAILGHDCIRRLPWRVPGEQDRSEYEQIASTRRSTAAPQQPFNVGSIRRTHEAVQDACKVIEALGLDPLRTTVDDLKDCEARLRCLSCPDYKGGYAYTWETAVSSPLNFVPYGLSGADAN